MTPPQYVAILLPLDVSRKVPPRDFLEETSFVSSFCFVLAINSILVEFFILSLQFRLSPSRQSEALTFDGLVRYARSFERWLDIP